MIQTARTTSRRVQPSFSVQVDEETELIASQTSDGRVFKLKLSEIKPGRSVLLSLVGVIRPHQRGLVVKTQRQAPLPH